MSRRIPSSIENTPEITVTIDGERLRGWEGVTVIRTIDSAADAFAISFPWDPTADNIRKFKPFQYQRVEIEVDSESLLSGTIDRLSFSSDSGSRSIQIDGRSATGILTDVSAGPPWQYESVKLSDICSNIGRFYGVTVSVGSSEDVVIMAPEEAAPTPAFDARSSLSNAQAIGSIEEDPTTSVIEVDPGQTAFDFLSSLAIANGLHPFPRTPADSASGRDSFLQFTDMSGLAARPAIADLSEGDDPVISISADFDATKRFSRYDVIQEANGETLTASAADNIPATRVKTVQPTQASSNIDAAAKAARARGYLESISVQATVTGWTYNGTFWAPGGIVTVNAPGAMIRDGGKLMIRQATYRIDESAGQVCDLSLTLPEAVSNRTPQEVPWFA